MKAAYLAIGAVLLAVAGCGATTVGEDVSGAQNGSQSWVLVAEYEGSRDESTEPFTLQGGQQRIEYEAAAGKYDGMVYFSVEGTTDDLLVLEMFDTGMVPAGETVTDESRMYLGGGDYYVEVWGVCKSWHVAIWEQG